MEVWERLPDDLSMERRMVVTYALALVDKVDYFWGGKSLVVGWDDRWGELTEVTAEGSDSTGTEQPYGLDCSGFVDWAFYNASGGEYVIGQGGGAMEQHANCVDIEWDEVQPGDLLFYPEDEHVGIAAGRDWLGRLLVVHCASGTGGVAISHRTGFETAARPMWYGEEWRAEEVPLPSLFLCLLILHPSRCASWKPSYSAASASQTAPVPAWRLCHGFPAYENRQTDTGC
jgi:hypothetical protein